MANLGRLHKRLHKPHVAILTTISPSTHYSYYLVGALAKRGLQLRVYASHKESLSDIELSGIEQIWTDDWRYIFQVWHKVFRDNPALLHIQHEFRMYGGAIGGVLFPLLLVGLSLINKPVVITLHSVISPDDLSSHYVRDRILSTKLFSPRLIVYELLKLYYRVAIALSSNVIVHTNKNVEDLITYYGITEEKIVRISHGVPELKNQPLKSNFDYCAYDPYMLYFGYLVPRKGVDTVIAQFAEIYQRIPEWKLIVAGGARDKDYLSFLHRRVMEVGLEAQVIILTNLSQEEVHNVMSRAKFLILPHRYSFGASGPLALAIAHDVPALAVKTGSLPDEVCGCGLLYDADEPSALGDGMISMAMETQDSGHTKYSEGLGFARARRSWDEVAKRTEEVYKTVAGCTLD